ncbi:MAG: hypothetical protein NUV53_04735 [Patescibacteria group bacterium]|nr:hypothetical protein [Patescibacteria group bacterium]
MDISNIQSKEIRWILRETLRFIPKIIINGEPPKSLQSLREELSRRVRRRVSTMREETIRHIGSYGLGEIDGRYWNFGTDEFLERTTLIQAGLAFKIGMSPKEVFVEIAFTTIIAITWDILHQTEYRCAEKSRRRSSAIV